MPTLDTLLSDQPELKKKAQDLIQQLKKMSRLAIAFSGGVDSTLLLKIAHDHLGQDSIALIGSSPSFPPKEKEEAINLARQTGVSYELVETSEMQDDSYLENTPQRCFYCRIHSMDELLQHAKNLGFDILVDGANADDASDHRPGHKAAKKLGVKSPLMDVGLTKKEIRQLARLLELSVWDKPASACLASRIPYGTAITIEALNQINDAETVLKDMGFRNVRVRHYNELARIELLPEDLQRAIDLRQEISHSLKKIGYTYITLDLDGFRSGSMNLILENENNDGLG